MVVSWKCCYFVGFNALFLCKGLGPLALDIDRGPCDFQKCAYFVGFKMCFDECVNCGFGVEGDGVWEVLIFRWFYKLF